MKIVCFLFDIHTFVLDRVCVFWFIARVYSFHDPIDCMDGLNACSMQFIISRILVILES